MNGAWWWIDRWRKSSAFLCMTVEEQGLYRNLLDAVWLFDDGIIPDDKRSLIMASGGDAEAWEKSGPKVLKWMQRKRGGWTNETALEVKAKTTRLHRIRSDAGSKGGSKRRSKTPSKTKANLEAPYPYPVNKQSIGLSPRASANPLVEGNRPTLESELLDLVRREAELLNRDPVEVMAEVSHYEGAKLSKLNPASMTDDRLLNSVLDARARVKRIERERDEAGT